MMRTAFRFLATLLVGLVIPSCASVQLRPLSSGETRLTHMEMPDLIKEDLQYEVILSVSSDVKPDIRKICFRWVTQQEPTGSPQLTTDSPKGSDFAREPLGAGWANPQLLFIGSDVFCAGPEDIRTDIPGKVIVRIRPANLRASYNKLEGHAEYLSEGRLRTTNKIGTRVIVER